MTNLENKLPKSTKRKTFKSKLKTLGGAGALSILMTLNSCGPKDLDVKKMAEKYQDATEHVEKAKNNLKNKEEAVKNAQEALQKAHQELIDAQKEASEIKTELKKESNKL